MPQEPTDDRLFEAARLIQTRGEGLLSMETVDEVIVLSRPPRHDVSVTRDGADVPLAVPAPIPGGDDPLVDMLAAAFRNGCDVTLRNLHRCWPPVGRLCAELGPRVGATLRLSSAGDKICAPAGRTRVVLMVAGRQKWRVQPPRIQTGSVSAAGGYNGDGYPRAGDTDAAGSSLEPGEVLIVPRGHAAAWTSEGRGLHIEFELDDVRPRDLVRQLLRSKTQSDPRWREALPRFPASPPHATSPAGLAESPAVPSPVQLAESPADPAAQSPAVPTPVRLAESADDACRRLLLELAREVREDPAGTLREAEQALRLEEIEGAVCVPDGHFVNLDRLPSLDLETRLRRRIGTPCAVSVEGAQATIVFPANRVSGPLRIEPALRFVAARTEPFTAADLPELSDNARIMLARTLVREGLLRLDL